jgi:hypothetical protein
MGLTEYRCRKTPEPVNGVWEADPDILYLCGIWECPENLYCGSPADYGLPKNMAENDFEEFSWDFIRFDDFFHSLLVIFTFLNVTGWSGTTFMVLIENILVLESNDNLCDCYLFFSAYCTLSIYFIKFITRSFL